MDAQATHSPVEELRRRVLRLDAEMREIRHQLSRLLAAEQVPTVSGIGDEIDPELLALVGIDPPLPRGAERKEIRRVVAARHSAP